MIEEMKSDAVILTTGNLREALAKTMKMIMDDEISPAAAKSLIGLATQINKTLDTEIKLQAQCINCKHKSKEENLP